MSDTAVALAIRKKIEDTAAVDDAVGVKTVDVVHAIDWVNVMANGVVGAMDAMMVGAVDKADVIGAVGAVGATDAADSARSPRMC